MLIAMRNGGKTDEYEKKKISLFDSNELLMVIMLVVVIAVFSILNRNYLSFSNMSNILMAASTIGLLAIGETYLIIAGHIDLSSAHIASMFGVLTAILINANVPWPLAIVIVVVTSSVVGLANSCLVNVFGMQPFIATLAMSEVCQGVGYLICDGKSIQVSNKAFTSIGSLRILGIPLPAILMLILFVIFGFILAKTVFGRSIYMIGGNAEAARLAGLKPQKISTILYVISTMVSAFAGVLMTAKMHSGQPTGGSGSEFDAITAAILGGVAFSGGKGNLLGCFIGLLIMQCFNNGLTVMNVSSFWQVVAKGLLLIAALIIDFFRQRRLTK
ncbi:MAG: ABC transporter permease [Clostridiales bacterium]|nr:ABC transporter permease [Clostridiales bacterium]